MDHTLLEKEMYQVMTGFADLHSIGLRVHKRSFAAGILRSACCFGIFINDQVTTRRGRRSRL